MIRGRLLGRVGGAALVVMIFSLLLASSASAFIYWGDSQRGSIGRANNDGSGVDAAFITGGNVPSAVAVDSQHVYWANQNGKSIGRANLDGTGVEQKFISAISEPGGVAVNDTSIFWTSNLANAVGRANLDGTNVKPSFIPAAPNPCGVAVDSGHLYWVSATGSTSYIGRAPLSGSSPNYEFVTIPDAFPCGVAVNSANIYWSDLGFFGGGSSIGRASVTTGLGVDGSIIGGAAAPCGIAVFGTQLYWANLKTNAIARANTDTTAVDQSFIATGGDQICGVAVDSGFSAPQSPQAGPAPAATDTTPPQTTIRKGPGNGLAKGKAKFRFRSSEPGSTFACKLDKGKAKKCKSPKTYKGLKPGKHKFKVWATDAAGNKDPTPAKRTFRVPAPAA